MSDIMERAFAEIVQRDRAERACEGLTLPAGVKPGAVLRLVEAAERATRTLNGAANDAKNEGMFTTEKYLRNECEWLRAALAEIGRK